MNLLRDNLLHKQVLSIEDHDEGFLLSLNDGSVINLYNRITLPVDDSVIGIEITRVELDEKSLRIFFGGNRKIEMGMQDADFIGPEAFLYHGRDGVLISS